MPNKALPAVHKVLDVARSELFKEAGSQNLDGVDSPAMSLTPLGSVTVGKLRILLVLTRVASG